MEHDSFTKCDGPCLVLVAASYRLGEVRNNLVVLVQDGERFEHGVLCCDLVDTRGVLVAPATVWLTDHDGEVILCSCRWSLLGTADRNCNC